MLKKWPILMMMMLAMAGVANAAYSGTPTAKANFTTEKINNKNCYKIGSAEDLYGFAAIVNGTNDNTADPTACGKLDADITVNENVLNSAGELNIDLAGGFIEWTPIGKTTNYLNAFRGTFYGQGHTISGLYFNNSGTDYVGLFAYTSGKLTIDGVGVVDSYFRGKDYVGGLVGYHYNQGSQKLSVNNSYNTGSVNGANYVGGLVGYGAAIVSVNNSYNTGFVNGSENVGGLVGMNGDIYFSYNTGSVTGIDNVGGLEGFAGRNQIIDCYNTGSVKEGNGVGNALLGEGCENVNTNMNSSYYLEGSGNSCGPSSFSGTADEFANGYVALKLHKNTAASGAGIWGQIVGADKTPTLTGEIRFSLKDDCFEIANDDDLYFFAAAVNNGVNSEVCVKLTADIKVNENVLKADGTLNGDGSSFTPWTPIGTWNKPFEGSFYGQGHTISGLYFNDTGAEDVGLFGDVYGDVIVDGVGLVDSYINASGYVGGIVGYARGSLTISDSYNASSVNTPGSGFGGLVGAAGGIYDGEELIVRGLLTISNSYNEGSLNGGYWGGGLVGYADVLVVSNSYNAGSVYVSGDDAYVGGITSKVNNASTVTNSFNYGAISAANSKNKDDLVAGGGVGEVTVTNSFTIGTSRFEGNGSTKKSVTEFADGTVLAALSNAEGGEVWRQYSDDAYPTFVKKSGTTFEPNADGYYEIATADDLYKFAEIVNNRTAVGSGTELGVKAKLMNDICVNACGEGESVLKADGTLNGNGSSFTPWTPIGIAGYPFIGTFDGQGHTISGLYFNDASESNVGLFGYVFGDGETVSISNVGVEDSYFNAQSAVGGVVGYAGYVALDMKNVYNAAVVEGSSFVGGVVGFVGLENQTLSMANVYNVGSIKGKDGQVGGLVGDFMNDSEESKITIENSYNYGNVGGGNPLVGTVENSEIEDAVMVTNSFYLGSSSSGDYGTVKSSTEFSDGTVYAQLHGTEDGKVWFQKPGDKFPTLSQEKNGPVVYEVTLNYPRAGSSSVFDSETISYVNGFAKSLPTMDKDGNPILGWYATDNDGSPITEIPATATSAMTLFPKMYVPAADGCYEIANTYQLYVFAAVVNGGKSTVCGKLTANIVVNENVLATASGESNVNAKTGEYTGTTTGLREWTPINNFNGKFDGNGFTISGLYYNGSENGVGLFGYLLKDGKNASIKNVGVEDSYFKGNSSVGGILGRVEEGSTVNIENVYNAAFVVAEVQFAGGIVGYDYGNKMSVTNAYNIGQVLALSQQGYAGGIVGKNYSDVESFIKNSYNYGTVSASTNVGEIVGGVDKSSLTVTNSFYLGVAPNGDYGTAKTAEQFAGTAADGNVLAALQSNADGYIWTQGVKYPKFGTYEPATDGCYEIATASQLYWFAAIVNDGKANACARLTANITVNENVLATAGGVSNVNASTGAYTGTTTSFIEWTPIGNNGHPFKGKFDGQGYTVSGLYFNGEGVYDVGLFGRIAGDADSASIANVDVADSYFGNSGEKGDHVGGVVGMVTHGGVVDVKNVSSAAVVVGYNGVGGVVGCVFGNEGDFELNITNAYNVGMVKGSDGVGGLVGDVTIDRAAHKIAINNSYNYGGVSFKMSDGGAPLIGSVVNTGSLATITVDDSYYLSAEKVDGDNAAMTAGEFADGTVLAALRSGKDGYVWVQNPGDKYPTIDVNASTNAKTIVLDWTSAADSTTLLAAGYTAGAMVIVKDGKKFYANGAIYEGILSAAQVATIADNKLYPISGVELATDNGVTTATLDGSDGARQSVMIPTNVEVDRVIYKRNITAGAYTTVMLPFDVDVVNNTSVKGKYTFYKFCGVGSDNLGTIINVAPVTTKFKANRPYIMIADADNSEGITFEKVGDSKYTLNTTTSSTDVTKDNWTMRGVYEYKVWPEDDEDLGYVYGFASKAGSGNQIGEFVEAGAGADIVPMRMYLKGTKPQSVRGNGKYNYSSHTGPAKVVRVQIVEGDGDDETTAIKHVATVPTVVKSNRWFDVKGRALNGKPTAKGTYYYNGQRVIIK